MKIFADRNSEIDEREIKHMALSRKMAADCIVLLENDGALPVSAGKVALYGNGARKTIKGGTGSGDVYVRSAVNIEQGLINAGFDVLSKNWLDKQDVHYRKVSDEYFTWLEAESKRVGKPAFTVQFDHPFVEPTPVLIVDEDIIKDTDTAIYVISRNSGEGSDRFNEPGDYYLFEEEEINIKKIASEYKNTIVVLNVGGVVDMNAIKNIDGVNSVVLMSQLGNTGGDALADVLLGKVTPSGKTTDTWAKDYMDYPSSAKFSHLESVDDEMYEDGVFVGYRYFDSFDVEPTYPFGYGLSYTNFEIVTENVSVSGTKVNLEICVKNIGNKYSGKEVVQVYYHSPEGEVTKPFKELAAYKKTGVIAPGEVEKVTISFDAKDMASYNEEKAAWVLDGGDYCILVGNSSLDAKPVKLLNLDKEVTVLECKNVFPLDRELNEIKPDNRKFININGIETISLDSAAFMAEKIAYAGERLELINSVDEKITIEDVRAGKRTVEELVAQLTVEEMAELCVGTSRVGEGGVVGNFSYIVPGAAADSSSIIKESRGVKNFIMADGPAGIRIQPHFKTDLEGNILPGGEMFGDHIAPFDDKYDETNSIDYYQYCTAIPIGWALAMSWDEAGVEELGDMIGDEMEHFGIDIWLAPALNIHRNPLCGRNFEYYSEDPLVAGKVAAAMTRGVQKHEGRGTTIKHFAANNQEDNRYFVNAHVSERAMREIYLKGFEITVKESAPASIMTSYNLLNGIHTANSYDLIQSVCRDEWKYDGVIMTDWFTSVDVPWITNKYEAKYPISASTGCIYAGNDLQMPGCGKNVTDIIEAVNENKEIDGYKITKADLQFCTCNIIKAIAKMD